jgi:hypothetical protein
MRVDLIQLPMPGGQGASPSLIAEWRVGAILEAIAVRNARGGQLWLEIHGQRYPARIASGDGDGPENGERLQLRVLRNSPVLALETLSSSRVPAGTAEAGIIAEALRRYVPRQESPALLLANLAWLATGKPGSDKLPAAILHAAAQLWRALPDMDDVADPSRLEASLRRSGAFLEADLAGGRSSFDNDVKALMLSLSRILRAHGARPAAAQAETAVHAPVPTARGPLAPLGSAPATFALVEGTTQQINELSRQTEGALARLTTTQISNSTPEGPVQSLLLELPVRQDDRATLLRLKIERDRTRRHGFGGGDAWSVEAAMDLGAIGALHAKVTLTGRRIGVQLRAESPAVVDALAQRSGELEAMLRGSGLEIDRVVCLHGMPATEVGARPARLLDVRA